MFLFRKFSSKALLLIIVSFSAQSSDMDFLVKTTPVQRAGVQTSFMTEKLRLDAQTQKKVAAINQKYADLIEPVLHNDDSSFSKMMDIRSLQGQKDAELETILSKEQFATYEDSRDELKSYMEQRLGH